MLFSPRKTVATLSSLFQRTTGSVKKKALFYYASSSLICQFLRFIGVLITTKQIAPDQFGLFAQATLVMSIAGLFREIGQTGALVAYQGPDRRYVFFNFQMNLFLGMAAAVLTAGSCLLPALIPPEIKNVVWLLAAILLIESLTLTNTLMLQKHFRFKALGVVEICALLVWLATVCVTIGRVPGFAVLLYAQCAEGFCRCLLLYFVAGKQFTGFSAGKDLQYYYFRQFALPVIPLVLVQGLLGRADYLLLSGLSTRVELGVYERLNQFSRIPISLSINLCDKVLMHSYSHAQGERGALGRMLRKSMLLIAPGVVLITGAVTLGLVIFLHQLVGTEWSGRIIRLWWFGIPFILLTPVLANLSLFFSGIGMQAQLLRNTAFSLITDLVFGSLLVGAFGAAGMLIAKSASGLLSLGYQIQAAHKRLTPLDPHSGCEPTV